MADWITEGTEEKYGGEHTERAMRSLEERDRQQANKQAADEDPLAHDPDDDAEDEGLYASGGALGGGVWENLSEERQKIVIFGVAIGLVVLSVLLLFRVNPFSIVGGGGDQDAPAGEAAEGAAGEAAGENEDAGSPGLVANEGSVAVPADAIPLEQLDIVFEAPVEQDGRYYLTAGSLTWEGELSDDATKLTLGGPTAAQFAESIPLDGGYVATGVYGRDPEGAALQHTSTQRGVLPGAELDQGTYYLEEGGEFVGRGAYFDTRQGDQITRVYVELDPRDPAAGITAIYARTFDSLRPVDDEGEVLPGPPIPHWVGHPTAQASAEEPAQDEPEPEQEENP